MLNYNIQLLVYINQINQDYKINIIKIQHKIKNLNSSNFNLELY